VSARSRAAAAALDGWIRRSETFLLGALMAVLTAVTFAQVVARYVFNDPLTWSEEAARYLFVWVSLVGAGAAVGRGAHYGLEALARRLPPGWRAAAGFASTVVVLAFAFALLITGITETQLASRQFSASLPMRMHLSYAALPVGAALMIWHVLALWARHGFGRHPLDRD
jgi:TRAP-type C4-dicarboxylate transport system permease small subunit